jgi:hypothetical protein
MKSKDKLLKIIERDGLLSVVKIFGDIDTIFNLVGKEIPTDQLIEFITELVDTHGLLGLGEGNWEEPIYFRGDEEHEHQISFLGHRKVSIDVVGSAYNIIDEYNIMYLNLPPRILRQICKVLYKNIDYLQ